MQQVVTLLSGERVTRNITFRPIDGGWCIHRPNDEYCVDVLTMAVNYRIVRRERDPAYDDSHSGYDRGWCYPQMANEYPGVSQWLRVIDEALRYDGGDYSEPNGYIKAAMPAPKRRTNVRQEGSTRNQGSGA